ncbi:MAG: ankyrin repeat domain-containing protein [Proteobacteria bacterium]|nr:ankyrin repeat domain-containing protein [Pseudomonadota bacterium]
MIRRKKRVSSASTVGRAIFISPAAAAAALLISLSSPAHSNNQGALSELLVKAVKLGAVDEVRAIVDAGADITQLDAAGRSPLDIAIKHGKFGVVRYLMLARRLQNERAATVLSASSSTPPSAPTIPKTVIGPVTVALPPPVSVSRQVQQLQRTSAPQERREIADKLASAAEKLAGAIQDLASVNTGTTTSSPVKSEPDVFASRDIHFYPSRKLALPVTVTAELAQPETDLVSDGSTEVRTATNRTPASIEPQLAEAKVTVPPAVPTIALREKPAPLVSRIFKSIANFLGVESESKPVPSPDIQVADTNVPPPLAPPSSSLPEQNASVLPLSTIDLDSVNSTSPVSTQREASEVKKAPIRVRKRRSYAERVEAQRIRENENERLVARSQKLRSETDQTANARRPTRTPLKKLRPSLDGVVLTMGNSVATGQPHQPSASTGPASCLQKRGHSSQFCIVSVDWPTEIRDAFSVNTILYQGSRAVARYDGGRAVHIHALFSSEQQTNVVDWAKKKFGPPTDYWRRTIAPFGKPRKPNPTFVWRSTDKQTKQTVVLEIRKFDDSRNVFPDTKHGSVRLYVAGGKPVFPTITALDIMSIDWAARSDAVDTSLPATANTLPVQR